MADRAKNVGKAGVAKVTGFFTDFRDFILKGNMVDLAVGMILGVAFGACVKSLVADIFNPCISLLGKSNMDDKYVVLRFGKEKNRSKLFTVEQAHETGAITLNYGRFIDTIINLLCVGFCLFIIVKLYMMSKKVFEKEEAAAPSTDWACPRCKESVKEGATRCCHCAADPIAPPPPAAEEKNEEKSPLLQKEA